MSQAAEVNVRGRYFSPDDLVIVKQCVKEYYHLGRTRISVEVCEALDWRQPNGWLKDRACRDVLRALEDLGHITLPPPLTSLDRPKAFSSYLDDDDIQRSGFDISTNVEVFPQQIEITMAKGNQEEKVWNSLVQRHHYLGYSIAVGRCIKLLITIGPRIVAALSFTSPAWRVESRDVVLHSLGLEPAQVADHVVNNSRFLMLPGTQVPNLASHILAVSARSIVELWQDYYSVTPVIAETFVQPSLYEGTCYRAANWVQVGVTKGYRRRLHATGKRTEPKDVLLYGLNRPMRRKIAQVVESCSARTDGVRE